MSKGAKKRLAKIQEIEQQALDALIYSESQVGGDANRISRELSRGVVGFYRSYAATLRVKQAESLLK